MDPFNSTSAISVIMPSFNQAAFISRAVESLKKQTIQDWELLIINDGSTDNTAEITGNYLDDKRIRYFDNKENSGLGASLNKGIEIASFDKIAYLPADDIYYKNHLENLLKKINENKDTVLVYSGIRHHYNHTSPGKIDGYPLQLVQVMHKKIKEKWTERKELESDDLYRLYWIKLEKQGFFTGSNDVTSEWVDHPHQRHKIIQEPVGGINTYRSYYNVKHPLRFHSTVGNYIDEEGRYKRFRERSGTAMATDGLKILLVGELAYNPERVLALEERGHKLYGLWMKEPYWYNYVGPLPFGFVEDIRYENWQEEIKRIKPDIIYALLNWQAVPFAHEILTNNPGIPFVWNFKEGPFICLEKGTWNKLMALYTKSDGQIYTSQEMKDWFSAFLPCFKNELSLILDGDLPKKDWFTDGRSSLLSEKDGEIHTVIPGRPIGLHPYNVAELAEQKIHLHFYGDFTHGQWKQWIEKTNAMANGYLHIHGNVDQENWTKEFSQYDAGWLHFFKSENFGEIRRANWDDLNIPARLATLVLSGLPLLQRNNEEHIVATQSMIKKFNMGLFFKDMNELGEKIRDKKNMNIIRKNAWNQREYFTFDYHADRIIDFFRNVINYCGNKN